MTATGYDNKKIYDSLYDIIKYSINFCNKLSIVEEYFMRILQVYKGDKKLNKLETSKYFLNLLKKSEIN